MICFPPVFSSKSYFLTILFQFENSLRRHNHVGLVHALLVGLARAGKLDAATESAKQKMVERRQKIKEGKMDEDEW